MSLRNRKKQETEQRIVEAATALFRENGYEATRTKDIAEAAGIATGTLFNYARTKADVVVLIWASRITVLVEEVMDAAARQSDPVDAVDAVYRPIFEFYLEDRELGRLFLQSVMFEGMRPDLQPLNQGFIARLAGVLGPHVDNPMTAALNVFSAYYCVVTMLLAGMLPDVDSASLMLRELVSAQRRGW